MLFVQTIIVDTFGTNGALWSLANEFWYYLLFPMALCAVRGGYRRLHKLLFAIGAVFIAGFVGAKILLAFPFWLLGAFLYLLPSRALSYIILYLSCAAYLCLFFLTTLMGRSRINWPILSDLSPDWILSVSTALFVWVALSYVHRASSRLHVRLARVTSRFSYSLYVTHTPVLVLMTGLITHDNRWKMDTKHLLLAAAVLVITLSYSYLFAAATEFRTNALRKSIEIRFGLGTSGTPVR
jgi:peptidoglycan/LPS O-acetylase OafA/YrhL